MGELLDKTVKNTRALRAKGHTVLEMWECHFKRIVKSNLDVKLLREGFAAQDRLEPRDAFFGGRTNAIKLFHECTDPGEKIKYVDFTSLYPWVCKYGRYPIGHPEIFLGDDIPHNLEGLLKCTILPPQNLYHPLLPYRSGGKLLFPLCRTCADARIVGICEHNDVDRAITGTWISAEVEKATALGYKILKKIEAWHFSKTERYDPATKTGGLWAPYMNLWLREKQQVKKMTFLLLLLLLLLVVVVVVVVVVVLFYT